MVRSKTEQLNLCIRAVRAGNRPFSRSEMIEALHTPGRKLISEGN